MDVPLIDSLSELDADTLTVVDAVGLSVLEGVSEGPMHPTVQNELHWTPAAGLLVNCPQNAIEAPAAGT